MLLKSLELQGFKSFPDKTKLTFNKGLTAVVGPNGSGKSNISDAVRWVLGEQSNKTLRGDKMEDVIFLGTQTRKSQGFAEVTLTLDNASRALAVDSDEVSLARKYYRSGESEYMINGASVRLKDINELLMDTGLGKDGYSIIGQGKIAEIVGAKSNERREIFEEAAGITKFRYRKNESEKRLKQAEENLIRLRDILAELEARVEPLRIQSEKAKKFLEYAEQKKILEITLWIKNLDKSKKNLSDQEDKITACKVEYDRYSDEIEQLEQQINDTYSAMQKCAADIDDFRREQSEIEAQISERNSQIAVYNNDIGHLRNNIAQAEESIASIKMSEEDAEHEIQDKQKKTEECRNHILQIAATIEKTEQELLRLSAINDDFETSIVQLNEKLNVAALEQTEVQFKRNNAERIIQENEQSIDMVQNNIEMKKAELLKAQEDYQENQVSFVRIEERERQLHNSIKGYELKRDSKAKKQAETEQLFHQLDLKIKEKLQKSKLLKDLEQNLEGYAYSVKTVLKQAKAGAFRGVFGTVSQIIEVDAAYSVAIETALGGAMQNLVCDNENTAKSAIRMLKDQNGGRATFLPLTSVKGTELSENGLKACDGFIALGSELIKADPKYDGVIKSLLGRIAVVEDLDVAVNIAKQYHYRFKIVTLDGQVINAGGSLTGGSQNKTSGLLSRKNDIAQLEEEASELTRQKAETEEKLSELTAEVNKLNAEINAILSELQTLSEDKIRFEGDQKRLEHIIAEDQKQLSDVDTEIKRMTAKNAELTEQISGYERRLQELSDDIQKANAKLEENSGFRDELSNKRNELADELSECRIEKAEYEKDIESLENAISDIINRRKNTKEQLTRHENAIDELRRQIAYNQEQIQSCESTAQSHRAEIETIDSKISEYNKKRNELDKTTTELRASEKEMSGKQAGVSQELARLEERKISIQKDYDDIISKMWEEYQLTRSEAMGLAIEIDNLIAAQRDLNEIKSKIKNLGSVNVGAIEEYKEVSERYTFMKNQIDDVEESKSELTSLISDLTEKMENIFAESFQKINEHFGKIFVELFGGGKAELLLTEPENVLESGIEIKVQPPGKIIKNLAALSGGEQSFIAIAIYFAILKVRPSPFCILDEIEAALDDVNVVKYANYLRLMSDNTQFILITHRRGSMEEADVLYGVTMQEQGVSKLLTLRVSEVEEQLGMKNIS